jgi:formylglycine-generating enzyme
MERRKTSRAQVSVLPVCLSLLAIAMALSACGEATSTEDPSESQQGALNVVVPAVPPSVRCIILTLQPGTDHLFAVAAGQSTTELKIRALDPGMVKISAQAFDVGCSPRPVADGATWVSQDPVDVVLSAGKTSRAQLTLVPNAGVNIGIGFQSPDVCAGMVTVPQGFCIDPTEVTRGQYAAWLATQPLPSTQDSLCAWNTSFVPDATCMGASVVCQQNCGEHPQVCVDWCDAAAYCKAQGKRLCGKIGGGANAYADSANPQTDQWMAACSSGGQNAWPYGTKWNETGICNSYPAHNGSTVPAASFAACTSPVAGYAGIYDMSGNVWEWEDSCDGAAGQTDNCHIRGGAWVNCFGAGVCDYPYNQDACYYSPGLTRQWADAYTGFRCCGP